MMTNRDPACEFLCAQCDAPLDVGSDFVCRTCQAQPLCAGCAEKHLAGEHWPKSKPMEIDILQSELDNDSPHWLSPEGKK